MLFSDLGCWLVLFREFVFLLFRVLAFFFTDFAMLFFGLRVLACRV